MEMIARALQRSKQGAPAPDPTTPFVRGLPPGPQSRRPSSRTADRGVLGEARRLDEDLLRANRVVAFDPRSGPTRHYDLLRNQVAQRQREPGGYVVAVSGPTMGCGATITAVNLAFSYARLQAVRVILVDASDDGGARRRLGLPSGTAQQNDPNGLMQVEVRDTTLRVTTNLARAIDGTTPRMRPKGETTVVVIDLPPLLTSDRVMPYLREADSVIVVLMEDHTTAAEIVSCKTFLGRREGIQYVLNNCGSHGL